MDEDKTRLSKHVCSELGSRISFKRKNPNPLFLKWLEELHEEAKLRKSELEPTINEARTALMKYPLPLKSGSECIILKGFHKNLCLLLDKRLEAYRQYSQTPLNSILHSEPTASGVNNQSIYKTHSVFNSKNLVNYKTNALIHIDNITKVDSVLTNSDHLNVEHGNNKGQNHSMNSETSELRPCEINSEIIELIDDVDHGNNNGPNHSKDSESSELRHCEINSEIIELIDDIKKDDSVAQSKSKQSNVKDEHGEINSEINEVIHDNNIIEVDSFVQSKSKQSKCDQHGEVNRKNHLVLSEISESILEAEDVDFVETKSSGQCRGNKPYKLKNKSGNYAILIALFEHAKLHPSIPSLRKDDLIEKAQIHSEESFTRPKPGSFYTAWSNVSQLILKGLVTKTRSRQAEYSLTDQGTLLAESLLKDSLKIVSTNDIIFKHTPMCIMPGDSAGVNAVPCTSNSYKSNLNLDLDNNSNNTENGNTSEINEESIKIIPGTFEIILLIDKNETGGCSKKNDPTVAQFKKYPDLKHEYKNLKIGDFTWVARLKTDKNVEFVLPYIIERKRMDDLGASIKDGRFHEQKFRLKKCGIKNVIYLVENYGSNKHVGLPLPSLMQALANTRMQDGFKIHMTSSLNDTTRFLAMMTKRLTLEYKDKNLKGVVREPKDDELISFEIFNKTSVKNRPLTVTETFIKLLLQLKGVSTAKALAITNVYPTPNSLIKTYMRLPQDEGGKLLANLKCGYLNRNVGPAVSSTIYQIFTNNDLI